MDFLNVDLPEDIRQHISAGHLNKAKELIDIYYKRNISSLLKRRLDFELLRIKMLKNHYTYSIDRALSLCKEKISDFKEQELQYLIDERYADWIYINGEIRLSNNFLDNTIKVNNQIKNRLIVKEPFDKSGELRKQVVNEIINNGSKSYYIHVKTGLKVKIDENVKGNVIKVHIPIPKNAQQIKGIKILNANHMYKYISDENYPQRTIYFEDDLKDENEFLVEYYYENHIKYNKLDYDNVAEVQPKFYLEEELPHIKFSPFLVDLANYIIKNEKNPLRKARHIYDYITQNVQYSYMRPYAAIESIAEYCGYNLKGDCGVQALLFITLCRIAGIPARWQSGLYVTPYYIGCHDWAEFYIEPYGWLFADPSFGGGARRNNDMIGWDFYFGNLDPFRMVANDYFQYPLYPEKKFLRSDPYDNQIGEAETEMMDLNNYVESILDIIEVKEINS
ncbi:transglutaminase-like domain-containing protein [Tissierella sp. Yu-01]|uniref:transglutaminase-like domain-containing protein n=1 Tax=Tissierella sp. Yu-01 TaxID=3035694 RepID=UPI00240DFCB6|nr:transglutaminase-like domain-containing protein [Tissierella sp. Yu-01]WFA10419.1 transglutaminase-like domain-containing protein [Tissierella sp. Yu-01]